MAIIPIWPTTRGLAWSVFKSMSWETILKQATSGKETSLQSWIDPIWEFRLKYNYLYDDPNKIDPDLGYTDLQTIVGFFGQMKGAAKSFYFTDPNDNSVTGQVLSLDPGSTTRYQCVRNIGGFLENIRNIAGLANLYFNGAPQAAALYTLDVQGGVNLLAPAPAGTVVSVDFSFYFRVRFGSLSGNAQAKDGDSMEWENFMYQLWRMKEVTLVTRKI